MTPVFFIELADTPELLEHLKKNYQYWKDMEEFEKNKEASDAHSGLDLLQDEAGVTSTKIEDDVIVEELS